MIRLTAPDIHEFDAVGNYCIDMAAFLRALGHDVVMYANSHAADNIYAIRKPLQLLTDIQTEDVIITHYSILDPNLDAILASSNRKLCYFHGVTPPEFLEVFEPVTADLCHRSQLQFPKLAQFNLIFANSHYSAKRLALVIGGKTITPLPPIFSSRPLLSDTVGTVAQKDGYILMVGRVVPHKNIELALAIFAVVRKKMANAHLTIVGEAPNTTYNTFLQKRTDELNITDAVTFTGKIGNDELRNHYQTASGLLCTSLHEGFCIPVLEAMQFGTPVFVRDGNAAAEVAADAGIIFPGDNAEDIGRMISEVLRNPTKKAQLVQAGRKRAQELLAMNSADFWHGTLQKLMVST